MPGFENQVAWLQNFDFTDPTSTHFHHLGNFTAAGDLAIGTGVPAPGQEIAVGHLVGAGGIVITYTGPNINIDGSGAGGSVVWQNISASQTLAVQNGYFCSGGVNLSLALPAVAAVGDTIEIVLLGSTSFVVTQAAGQQIQFGNQMTTLGAGGSLHSLAQGDALTLICQQANNIFVVRNCMGNLTYV